MSARRRKAWLAFGLWLPILCFVVDHRSFHVYGAWTTCVRWFVALELALFATHAWRPAKSDFLRGAMLTAFSMGALFALLTGLLLLEASLIGMLALIGLLGLVPWGTALAYAHAARDLANAVLPHIRLWHLAGALAAAAVLLGPPALWRRHEVVIARAALEELSANDDHVRALELLALLPHCDTRCLPIDPELSILLRSDLEVWIEWNWTDHLHRFPMRWD